MNLSVSALNYSRHMRGHTLSLFYRHRGEIMESVSGGEKGFIGATVVLQLWDSCPVCPVSLCERSSMDLIVLDVIWCRLIIL